MKISRIGQLNREIAQHVFNKKASNKDRTVNVSNSGDADSPQPFSIDTKKDLLYKIHVKNKYIKRLLSENDAMKEEIDRQKEEILILNVSLKQTAHRLTKAIGDLSEQTIRQHMTADDMTDLHAKINSVREQMTQIEYDKQKYKNDVLYLGEEIQKKINQWNELLKKKFSSTQQKSDAKTIIAGSNEIINVDDGIIDPNEIDANGLHDRDENLFEVNVLSQAIIKRNIIIADMESLLIDLTMEISQSAVIINRIIKNWSTRETNFATNLEKLHNHLAKILQRPNTIEHETQTIPNQRHKLHECKTNKKAATHSKQ